MAEEKPFEPTPSRLARARREGDVPRSQDLAAAASFGCGAFALATVLPPLAAAMRAGLSGAVHPERFSPWPYAALAASFVVVAGCSCCGALLATLLPARTLPFTFPAPKFDKLNPLPGFKRMVSRDALLGGAKALVVSGAAGATIVPGVVSAFGATAGSRQAAGLAALAVRTCEEAFAGALIVALLFAGADLLLERAKWKRRLRMSFAELKRDLRQNDGDPLLRGRRRQTHRALVRGSVGRVKQAAFVVANPVHVAIALEYRPPEVAVPRVLVRAIDAGALEVKRRAREHRIPIVENVALARRLLATTESGDYIPADTYLAVAAIVAALLRTKALAS